MNFGTYPNQLNGICNDKCLLKQLSEMENVPDLTYSNTAYYLCIIKVIQKATKKQDKDVLSLGWCCCNTIHKDMLFKIVSLLKLKKLVVWVYVYLIWAPISTN